MQSPRQAEKGNMQIGGWQLFIRAIVRDDRGSILLELFQKRGERALAGQDHARRARSCPDERQVADKLQRIAKAPLNMAVIDDEGDAGAGRSDYFVSAMDQG